MKKVVVSALVVAAAHSGAQAQRPTVLTQEKNTFLNPAGLFDARRNGFSHVAQAPAGAELVYVAGQWASDAQGRLVSPEFEAQARQTLQNLKTALAAAGLSTRHVIKQTVYIADFTPEKKAALLRVAATEWGADVFPAGTIVPVPVLATAPGCQIEMEVIASK